MNVMINPLIIYCTILYPAMKYNKVEYAGLKLYSKVYSVYSNI